MNVANLRLGHVGAGGDHALDQQFPIGRSVPGAAGDQRDLVAGGAGSLDDGLGVARGQRTLLGLTRSEYRDRGE